MAVDAPTLPVRTVPSPNLTISRCDQLVRSLRDQPMLWTPQLRPLEHGRWYTPLFDSEDANAWLILWAPGAVIDMHDHGSSSASVTVVRGRLTETYRSLDQSRFDVRELRAPEVVAFGPDHVHEIANRRSGTAASLHVYSPRLESMTYLDDRGSAAFDERR